MQDFLSAASMWVPEFLVKSGWMEHAPFGFWLIDIHRPRVLVELGTHTGYSYLVFNQAIKELGLSTRSFAIDTWEGDEHTGFYGEDVFQELRSRHEPRYSAFSELVRSTFDEAVDRFEDGSIDLLHIDGRHYYDDVKTDFDTWKPKLSPRGVVLLHDTCVHEHGFGVFRLWDELKSMYPHFEFYHSHGLGVLGVGRSLGALEPLFECGEDSTVAREVRDAYGRLGRAVGSSVLADECEAARAELRSTQGKLAEANALLHQMHMSVSWRVTEPMRAIGQRMPWLKTHLRQLVGGDET